MWSENVSKFDSLPRHRFAQYHFYTSWMQFLASERLVFHMACRRGGGGVTEERNCRANNQRPKLARSLTHKVLVTWSGFGSGLEPDLLKGFDSF